MHYADTNSMIKNMNETEQIIDHINEFGSYTFELKESSEDVTIEVDCYGRDGSPDGYVAWFNNRPNLKAYGKTPSSAIEYLLAIKGE